MSKFWQKKYISKYTGAEIDAAVAAGSQVPEVTVEDAGMALVVDEEGKIVAGSAGTTVVANPTLAGTESALTGLEVGDTKYKVEQPINVVANPTLAGTEAALEGLQVGDTKYKVGGGDNIVHYEIPLTLQQYNSLNDNDTVTISGLTLSFTDIVEAIKAGIPVFISVILDTTYQSADLFSSFTFNITMVGDVPGDQITMGAFIRNFGTAYTLTSTISDNVITAVKIDIIYPSNN